MGPDGSSFGIGAVRSGHFSEDAGFKVVEDLHRAGIGENTRGNELIRRSRFNFDELPSRQTMDDFDSISQFEAGSNGFREALEADPHGRLHLWIGGRTIFGNRGTMNGMSSPNDPIFFMHHATVDWMWARWQDNGHSSISQYPANHQRYGHALNDAMWPWDANDSTRTTTDDSITPYLSDYSNHVTPADVWNFRDLGYTYDTLLPLITIGNRQLDQALAGPDDEQGYRVEITVAGQYRFETHGSSDTVLSLHGPSGWRNIAQSASGGADSNAQLITDLQPGAYYVVVKHASGGSGKFDLTVAPRQIAPPAASPIPQLFVNGSNLQAAIGTVGERDRFRFTADTLGNYTIQTEGATDVFLSLYGPNDATAFVTSDDDSGSGFNARINSRLSAGEYYVEVRHYFGAQTGDYQIGVSAETTEATLLEIGGAEFQGEISNNDESDLFRFDVTNEGRFVITTTGSTDTFLTLFGPDSETLEIASDDDSGPGLASSIQRELTAGTYYARVRHHSRYGRGEYGISVSQS